MGGERIQLGQGLGRLGKTRDASARKQPGEACPLCERTLDRAREIPARRRPRLDVGHARVPDPRYRDERRSLRVLSQDALSAAGIGARSATPNRKRPEAPAAVVRHDSRHVGDSGYRLRRIPLAACERPAANHWNGIRPTCPRPSRQRDCSRLADRQPDVRRPACKDLADPLRGP